MNEFLVALAIFAQLPEIFGSLLFFLKRYNLARKIYSFGYTSECYFGLGLINYHGFAGKTNYQKAFQYFKKSHELEDPGKIRDYLGLCYAYGNGTRCNLNLALKYIQNIRLKARIFYAQKKYDKFIGLCHEHKLNYELGMFYYYKFGDLRYLENLDNLEAQKILAKYYTGKTLKEKVFMSCVGRAQVSQDILEKFKNYKIVERKLLSLELAKFIGLDMGKITMEYLLVSAGLC